MKALQSFKHGFPKHGFTLAELLIALAILGVIATFTIPKILVAQRNAAYNSIAKESAGLLANAYLAYKQENTADANTGIASFTPYINYIKLDTTGTEIDVAPSNSPLTSFPCETGTPCLLMANGARIWLWDVQFGGTSDLHFIYFLLDPDGKLTGQADSIWMSLYYNGRMATEETTTPGSISSEFPGGTGPTPDGDPDWFSWN